MPSFFTAKRASVGSGRRLSRAAVDLLLVAIVTVAGGVLSILLDAHERLIAATRPWERWELDELFAALLALAIALSWYAWRRWTETSREAVERKRVGEALQQAHDELENRVAERTEELSTANALLHQEIAERKRAEEAPQQAHSNTVLLVAAAAEAHDQTTGLHLQSVRALTKMLARQLGYSAEDTSTIGLAAALHDIGKIRVPNAILASSGKLEGEDWEEMKRHTTWGAEFLAARPGFELAAAIALHHHEQWDGSGYPDGLVGDAIPEAATIVAVADAFDAITHDRPYRAGSTAEAALREIVAHSTPAASSTRRW